MGGITFCPNWARDGRRTRISLVSHRNRNRIFRLGDDWKIEEPNPCGNTERWRTMYALWNHERVAGSSIKRWMFERLLTRQEAELYGRGTESAVR